MNASAQPPFRQRAEQNISPELELLLLCAQRTLSGDRVQHALELLRQPLSWSVLIEQAERHGLFPLLYWHVTKSLGFDLPPEIKHDLDQRFRANVAHSLRLIRDLTSTVGLLANRGIQAIPFKGPMLAESLYGNAALRECVDLDILVRPRDLPEAVRTLISAGYSAPRKLAPSRQDIFIATQYEYPLLTPSGTLVELQWRIVPRYFSLSLPDGLWSRIRAQSVGARNIDSLSWEDLLLLLCFHGGKHGWARLIWLADVAELVSSNPRLDWEYVIDHARRAGGLRMLLLGVTLAESFLESAVPARVKQPLAQDPAVEEIAEHVRRDLLAGDYPAYLRSQLYLLRVRERWRDRLRYMVRFTFTDTPMEWEIVDFPPPFGFLYRVLRVLRGLLKGWSLALGAISRLAKARL